MVLMTPATPTETWWGASGPPIPVRAIVSSKEVQSYRKCNCYIPVVCTEPTWAHCDDCQVGPFLRLLAPLCHESVSVRSKYHDDHPDTYQHIHCRLGDRVRRVHRPHVCIHASERVRYVHDRPLRALLYKREERLRDRGRPSDVDCEDFLQDVDVQDEGDIFVTEVLWPSERLDEHEQIAGSVGAYHPGIFDEIVYAASADEV